METGDNTLRNADTRILEIIDDSLLEIQDFQIFRDSWCDLNLS